MGGDGGLLQGNLPSGHLDGGIKRDAVICDIRKLGVVQFGIFKVQRDHMIVEREAAHVEIVKDGGLHPDGGIVHAAVILDLGVRARGDDAICQFKGLVGADIGAFPAEPQPHIDIKRPVTR